MLLWLTSIITTLTFIFFIHEKWQSRKIYKLELSDGHLIKVGSCIDIAFSFSIKNNCNHPLILHSLELEKHGNIIQLRQHTLSPIANIVIKPFSTHTIYVKSQYSTCKNYLDAILSIFIDSSLYKCKINKVMQMSAEIKFSEIKKVTRRS